MFKRNDFFIHLQSRFQRPRHPFGVIPDMYDASLYFDWVNYNNNFLENPHNISFTWYTDGIPVFKSSKVSAWPLYLTINELPFELRYRKENILLAGLWYEKKKNQTQIISSINFVRTLRNYFKMASKQYCLIHISSSM